MDHYIMASESVVLDVLGYKEMASIKPGEAVYIEMSGRVHRKQCSIRRGTHPASSSLFT